MEKRGEGGVVSGGGVGSYKKGGSRAVRQPFWCAPCNPVHLTCTLLQFISVRKPATAPEDG